MGMMMGSSILDFQHISDSANHPHLPQKPITAQTNKLERHKKIIKEKFDDALLYEQEAMQLEQKASYSRQMSMALQREAILKNLEYG